MTRSEISETLSRALLPLSNELLAIASPNAGLLFPYRLRYFISSRRGAETEIGRTQTVGRRSLVPVPGTVEHRAIVVRYPRQLLFDAIRDGFIDDFNRDFIPTDARPQHCLQIVRIDL